MANVEEAPYLRPLPFPDENGLSVDSLRGSEQFIRPDFIGHDDKYLVRDDLSYHEATTLQAAGREIPASINRPNAVLPNSVADNSGRVFPRTDLTPPRATEIKEGDTVREVWTTNPEAKPDPVAREVAKQEDAKKPEKAKG
jgi:hypothetical protein